MKKNVVMVFLVILVLGLGGYLVYDKLISGTESNDITEESSNYKFKTSSESQHLRCLEFEVYVDNGQAYLMYFGNEQTDNINNVVSKFSDNEIKSFESPDGAIYKSYKLGIDNIVSGYYVTDGNAPYSYFVFILENGEVTVVSEYDLINKGEINTNKLEGLTDIVSIVQGGTFGSDYIYALDINGNTINLSKKYLSKYNN